MNGLSQENYLRENYYPDMVEIENGYFFQRRAADALKEFLAAARAQGFTVSISRTYMSYPDQRTRFNGMASTIYDRGEMSLADAEKEVAAMGYYPRGRAPDRPCRQLRRRERRGEILHARAGMDARALRGIRLHPALSRRS